MRLSPVSIRRQEFNKGMRGYETAEVDKFLEKVAEDFEEILVENEEYKQSVYNIKEELEQYKNLEVKLRNALLNAEDSAKKALSESRSESDKIIAEANSKAGLIIQNAKTESERLMHQVVELKEQRNLLIAKLKAVVETQEILLKLKKPEDRIITTAPAVQKLQGESVSENLYFESSFPSKPDINKLLRELND